MMSTPRIIKHLLIVNIIFFVGTQFSSEISNDILSLHYFENEKFIVSQIFTHMFMHGNLAHIAFNMLALWMFGSTLVNVWGNNKFIFFYFSCGVGAALVQLTAYYLNIQSVTSELLSFGLTSQDVNNILLSGRYDQNILDYISENRLASMYFDYNAVMVGASGAIYGVVVAFAFLFPNSKLMLLFPPIPIKAKFLVPLLIVGDIFFGFTSASIGPIAHFAHLGGALTGFIMMWYWKKNQFNNRRWN
ncbi:MAG: rhomboid family intramembrane serine protease [Flavobacteriaceae bacterium]